MYIDRFSHVSKTEATQVEGVPCFTLATALMDMFEVEAIQMIDVLCFTPNKPLC